MFHYVQTQVETEFSDRMDQLRNMYKSEIDGQAEKLEKQRVTAKELETRLRESIAEQKKEIDELNT